MWKIGLSLIKYVLILTAPIIVPFVCLYIGFFVYWRFVKGLKPRQGVSKYIGFGSKIKRIFWDMPKQHVYDRLVADPDYFQPYGVHVVAGEQGNGKTVTVAYMLRRFKKMYPKLKIKTNFGYKFQDGEINHWRDVVASENGIYGEIDVLDEMQNWFNSLQSKDFPPEMMTEITQQRKQRKCIIGTSQVFTRVSKPIREQTYILYEPITLFGCLTIVRKFKPEISADGIADSKKMIGMFFFVHDKELRESYDTYHKIEKMSEQGFKSEDKRI